MDKNKNAGSLGKGLSALLGGEMEVIAPNSAARIKSDANSYIKIASIEASPFQPRSDFEEEKLEELAQSIRHYGLIQPITVRPVENGKYQLISGERRLRACKMAGLTEIPAFVRTADDLMTIQMALVENIQREDLNAIEIAISYQRLIDECNLNQDELSDKVGKNRSTISNYLRLLKLSREAQIAVRDKKISMAHARAIVVIEDDALQAKLVNDIITQGLSVRQIEAMVKKHSLDYKNPKTKIKITLSDQVVNFQTSIAKKLNTKVKISKDISGKGKISIAFNSDEELKKIISILS